MFPKEFFIVPEEVFRLGNSTSPKLAHVRPHDVRQTVINGIIVVVANNKGISVFDKDGIARTDMSGWVWKFAPSTPFPVGLKLVNDKPGHFCIAPTSDMPLDKYKGLLEELALKAMRVFYKQGAQV
ncbi:hypothetical protein ACTJKJ_18535 [Roseateles sp. 22389]|uniref:Tse2 family ADP-ribosyltransferase toxin n=1 Tax=Roseateles sp. 22389 TaxID=3453916 RepID=UPI003F86ECF6